MRKIAVINQKGGVGKTTTSINVAGALGKIGMRVLLIDMDAQGNVANCFKMKPSYGTSELLTNEKETGSLIQKVNDNLDVILSDHRLAATELELSAAKKRERRLRDTLSKLEDTYDYVLLDCPPTLNLLNQNALMFSEELLIPVTLDDLGLIGASKILKLLIYLKEEFSHEISRFMLVPTMYDKRTRVSKDCLDLLHQSFPGKVADPVRLNTKFRESTNHGKTIFDYENYLFREKYIKEKKGSLDYLVLAKYIVGKGEIEQVDELKEQLYAALHRREE